MVFRVKRISYVYLAYRRNVGFFPISNHFLKLQSIALFPKVAKYINFAKRKLTTHSARKFSILGRVNGGQEEMVFVPTFVLTIHKL